MTNTSLLTTRSSRMRNVNAKTSNLSLASTISVNFNSELSSKADNNGDGIVYHRSDCGYPNVRSYGAGGRWGGSGCDRWVSTERNSGSFEGYFEPSGKYITVNISKADLVWYGIYRNIEATARNVNYKIIGSDHNWSIPDLDNFRYS